MISKQSGMTLVEALVANVILIVAIYASLTIFNDMISSQVFLERGLNFVVARNRVVSHLLDEKTWTQTVAAAENTAFSCLVGQDQSADPARDCTGVTDAKFNVYALDATQVFNSQNPNFGFSNTGANCATFQTPPATGDGSCPLGANLTVTAECPTPAITCANPTLRFSTQFTYNPGDTRHPLNIGPFAFTYVASGLFCPNQAAVAGWVGDGQIIASASAVDGKTSAAQDGHFATTTPGLLPCRIIGAEFVIVTAAYDGAHVGNQTMVCLADDASGNCLMTFIHKPVAAGGYTYELRDDTNAVIATPPAWLTLNGSEAFKFDITNGLVKFCVDSHCLHIFEKKLDVPFRLKAEPAYTTGPGTAVIDSLSLTIDEL